MRVALKGTIPQEFSKLTGAKPEAFELQLRALENLHREGVSCHTVLIDIAKADRGGLVEKLSKISLELAALEVEPLIAYPAIRARLEKAKII